MCCLPNKTSILWRTLALGVLSLWVLLVPAHGEEGAEQRRIIAIGDIHGAYDALVDILKATEIIDKKKRWIGGDTILVQTGDYMDRGTGTQKVLELLIDLEAQAPKHGGEVITLLGNHEVFNLIGVYKDVTHEILHTFEDRRSSQRRERLCRAWSTGEYSKEDDPLQQAVEIQRCLMRHPAGLMEYIQAFSPEGKFGQWLRQRPVAAQIGDVVFLHGGLSPQLRGKSLDEINRQAQREIDILDQIRAWLVEHRLLEPTASLNELVQAARDTYRKAPMDELREDPPGQRLVFPEDLALLSDIKEWLINSDEGPVWFRGYSTWSNKEGNAEMPRILAPLGAKHVVVGHTPQNPRSIRSRFEDRVFLIDTGMLGSVYTGGRAAALEILGQRFTAIYVNSENVLLDAPGPLGLTNEDGSTSPVVATEPED